MSIIIDKNFTDLTLDIENNDTDTTDITDETQKTSIIRSNSYSTNCRLKSLIWFLIMFIIFPIAFCDLYYGYTDDTCVSESTGRLVINLKDYLLVWGWINIGVISLLSFGLCFLNIDAFNIMKNEGNFICCNVFITIVSIMTSIFFIIWDIFGAIIFWKLMDTSKCSNSTYNYVFVSLIIKLVFNINKILKSKNDKNK